MLPLVVYFLLFIANVEFTTGFAIEGRQRRNNAARSDPVPVILLSTGTRTRFSTIYSNNDNETPMTAAPGYDFRIDPDHYVWGSCLLMTLEATKCGLAGQCFDNYDCAQGCGATDIPYGTVTW
ncbi:uncharacterized protein C8A04DRAFT_14842 [Dichotomopilus funicola]|uniref:Uncharacterized protein n=1 Tax=Dichotomopilus funicola TaxID=1934379 RepID=A0AAN6UWZ2_9PEZI|nr:hypothetical protein C8A04DRAFT_14842 [Dichotomopilus funicola]